MATEVSLVKHAAKPPEGAVLVDLPLGYLGVLRQMRTKFREETLQELAESLKAVGQMSSGIVVALKKGDAVRYIQCVNATWRTKYRLHDFPGSYVTEKKELYYFFIVAGERRYRACGIAKKPTYFCQLRFDLDFNGAIALQAQENLHEQLAPQDLAGSLALIWRAQKLQNKKLTLAKFARSMGTNPEAIRRSVRYVSLPIVLQDLVNPSGEFGKGVSYPILCELARLQEAQTKYGKRLGIVELKQYAYAFVGQKKTAKQVTEFVTQQIERLKQEASGDRPLFELSVEDVVEGTKNLAASGMESYLRAGHQHFEAVAHFHKDPSIGRVASEAAVRGVVSTLAVAKTLAPEIISGIRGGRGAGKARQALGGK